MDTANVIALLMALGVGGLLSQVIRWFLGGRKESQTTAASSLSGSAADLAAAYEKYATGLTKRLEALEGENANLRADVRGMERKLDRVLTVVDRERSWAERALADLTETGAPYPKPPIFALNP